MKTKQMIYERMIKVILEQSDESLEDFTKRAEKMLQPIKARNPDEYQRALDRLVNKFKEENPEAEPEPDQDSGQIEIDFDTDLRMQPEQQKISHILRMLNQSFDFQVIRKVFDKAITQSIRRFIDNNWRNDAAWDEREFGPNPKKKIGPYINAHKDAINSIKKKISDDLEKLEKSLKADFNSGRLSESLSTVHPETKTFLNKLYALLTQK
mgnify:CR=1 FL=1|tara:strand:+ start:1328 stop:1957 length:630 start_codon:yes stop_codon:yes gene_type:complete